MAELNVLPRSVVITNNNKKMYNNVKKSADPTVRHRGQRFLVASHGS